MKTFRILINLQTLNEDVLKRLKELEEKGFIRGGMIVCEDEQENEVKEILDAMI